MKSRSIKKQKIHQDLVNVLVEDITKGLYKPGDTFPSERSLMEEFSVGRPAVREAMSRLERMGLINIRPGVKAVICEPTINRLMEDMSAAVQILMLSTEGNQQLQQVRIFFECALVRSAAQLADEKDLADLEGILKESAKTVTDIESFADCDMQFHHRIAQISRNKILLNIESTLNKWLLDQRLKSLGKKDQAEIALEAHKKIFLAIKAGVLNQAEQEMREHLEQVDKIQELEL